MRNARPNFGKTQLLQPAPDGTSVAVMARKLRLEYAGACYHVINRGNYRWHLFGSKAGGGSSSSARAA
jgi:hypothetical protein